MINPVSPKKLLHGKWTAVQPRHRDKHFLVVEVLRDEQDVVRRCILEAVLSKRRIELDWRDLKDADAWRIGWR